MRSKKNNARNKAGKGSIPKLAGGGTEKKNTLVWECSPKHITKLISELRRNHLDLSSVSRDTQCRALGKVLQYLGERGLNTYEGTAAGYARLATRIQDLEADGWIIDSKREDLIGPDGLFHPRVARYVFIAKSPGGPAQMPLELVPA
jgi:hypothetical protein